MPKKNTGLGRGLDSIFKDNYNLADDENVTTLRIAEIEPRINQPRKMFDDEALKELADSISEHGVLQPLIVNRTEYGTYRIIAGERRWRAAKLAGLTELPVVVMNVEEKSASEIALIENIQRENLNPAEEANAYRALMRDFGMTQEDVAIKVGKSRSAVANSLRLCELPDRIMGLLERGKLSAGHARAILGLNDMSLADDIANQIIAGELSVRQTESLVKKLNGIKKDLKDPEECAYPQVNYTAELAKNITKKLGRNVKIINRNTIKKIEIEFENDTDLNEIAEKLFGDDIFD